MFIWLHLKSPQIVKRQLILSAFTKKYYRIRLPLMMELQKMLNSRIGNFKLQMLEAPRKD